MSDILTDEQVRDAFERLFSDWKDTQLEGYHRLKAHIDALRAERDAYKARCEALERDVSDLRQQVSNLRT